MLLCLILLPAVALAADKVCDVTKFGAKGDNATKDTAAINAAISACKGGGEILLPPPGRYLSGPFNLTDNQVLVSSI